jgi:hypothetical protein
MIGITCCIVASQHVVKAWLIRSKLICISLNVNQHAKAFDLGKQMGQMQVRLDHFCCHEKVHFFSSGVHCKYYMLLHVLRFVNKDSFRI